MALRASGELHMQGTGGCNAKQAAQGEQRPREEPWHKSSGSGAEEAARGESVAAAHKHERRCPKGPAGLLPATRSFADSSFSTNKSNIYFQQVAGGR